MNPDKDESKKESFSDEAAPQEHDTPPDTDEGKAEDKDKGKDTAKEDFNDESSPKKETHIDCESPIPDKEETSKEDFNDESSPKKMTYPNTPTHTHVTIETMPSPTTTIIKEKVRDRSLATGLMLGMKKPVLLFVVVMLIGLAITNFFAWFEVPGLNDQIARLGREVDTLDEEVDKLTEQVDRLKVQNDRYRTLNEDLKEVRDDLQEVSDELNMTVIDLEETNTELNATKLGFQNEIIELGETITDLNTTIIRFEDGLLQLNITNERLKDQVQELEKQKDDLDATVSQLSEGFDTLESRNEELQEKEDDLENVANDLNSTKILYTALNGNLTIVVESLTVEVEELQTTVDDLTVINGNLKQLEIDLTEIVRELNDTSVDQEELLIKLQKDLVNFTAENDRLEKLNEDIDLIIALIESDNFNGQKTLIGVEDWLKDQVNDSETQLATARNNLIDSYGQSFEFRTNKWRCNFPYKFYGYEWAKEENSDIIIDDIHVPSVIDYIEKRMLRPHCLDTANFVAYDQHVNTYGPSLLRLKRSIDSFAILVDDYYFSPGKVDTKISVEHWLNASYECENLENNYIWTVSSSNVAHS